MSTNDEVDSMLTDGDNIPNEDESADDFSVDSDLEQKMKPFINLPVQSLIGLVNRE